MAVWSSAFWVGTLVSLVSSWWLVGRLESLGARFGLSDAMLGLIAALAADSPEITAAVTALAHRQDTVGIGVVLGSNVFNLAALLGVAAVAAGGLHFPRRLLVFDGGVALWIAAVSFGAASGAWDPLVALLLSLAVLIPYVAVHTGWRAGRWVPEAWKAFVRRAVAEEQIDFSAIGRPSSTVWRDLAGTAVTLVGVVLGSIVMERAATTLGQRWDIPDVVVGGLILAAVTSLPNAVAGQYLARRGRANAVMSTALNSNTINVVAGMLGPGVITGLAAPSSPGLLVAGSYIGGTFVVLVWAWYQRGLTRRIGWTIIAGYVVFGVTLALMAGR